MPPQGTESSSLLGNDIESPKRASDYSSELGQSSSSRRWRRAIDISLAFVLGVAISVLMGSRVRDSQHPMIPAPVPAPAPVPVNDKSSSSLDEAPKMSDADSTSETTSKYNYFQALGFQIYTGGAPAIIQEGNKLVENPECEDLDQFGYFEDFDADEDAMLWQCYLGHADWQDDVEHRLQIMTEAVEKAYESASTDSDTLKIFIAPEFFFRGREGAYVYKEYKNKTDDDCAEVCQIIQGLEKLVANKKYEDWLFLFGTIILSETLSEEDSYDYLFYNFAPLYKGYDPDTTDHSGKRFLVPKRYVSNNDFLTPIRQYNGTEMTEEIMELTEQQREDAKNLKTGDVDIGDEMVLNPFKLHYYQAYYDRDMWYNFKDELTTLGYEMIQYDWLILDNITFTVEVCLDHLMRTALNTYLTDNVLGSHLRIPKIVEDWNSDKQKMSSRVEQVQIPRQQAQISLVSSFGMNAEPDSLALVANGTFILHDGEWDSNGTMAWLADCDLYTWHFNGGTEYITRTPILSESRRVDFRYHVHAPITQIGIYGNIYDDEDTKWKQAIQGAFTTTNFAPKITVYPQREIAKV